VADTEIEIRIRPIDWKRDLVAVSDLDFINANSPKIRGYFEKLRLQKLLIRIAAEHHGSLIGSLFCLPLYKSLRLINIVVERQLRRRRVASKLLQKLIEEARRDGGFKVIKLFVRETDNRAREFFIANGFRAVGVSRNFYEKGGDAYRMEFLLDELDE